MEDKLDKLFDYVSKEEEKYYELSFKEMDRGNITGLQVMQSQASAFQRVRYAIEDLMSQ